MTHNSYLMLTGHGVIKESTNSLTCIDDDVGHVYTTFNKPGDYTVSVSVEDGSGNKAKENVTFTVF